MSLNSLYISVAAGQSGAMPVKEALSCQDEGRKKIKGGMKETVQEGRDRKGEWILKSILKAASRGI